MEFITKDKIYNLTVYGFGQVVNLVSPLLIIPYIVTICGETGLGKAGVGFSFALISIVLVDYGSYINGTKYVSINKTNKINLEEKFCTIYFAKFFLLLAVLFFCSLLIISIPFFEKDKTQIFLSLLIVVGQFINPTWFFQGIQNFKWITIINVLSKGIYIVAVFLFIKTPKDYIFINAFFGVGLIIGSVLGFLWILWQYSFSLRKCSFSKALVLIKEEFSLTVSQLFFSFYQYSPIILISYVCGNFIAGQYRIIDQIVMIFRTYLQMFFNFTYAEICLKIFENLNHGLTEWKKYNGYNYILILIILFIFFTNTNRTLMFFNVNIQDVHKLEPYFKIGLFIPIFMSVSFALRQLMFSFEKNKLYIKITIISSILNVVLMVFLLKLIGLKGAFLSTIIVEFLIIVSYLVTLMTNITSKEKIKVKE